MSRLITYLAMREERRLWRLKQTERQVISPLGSEQYQFDPQNLSRPISPSNRSSALPSDVSCRRVGRRRRNPTSLIPARDPAGIIVIAISGPDITVFSSIWRIIQPATLSSATRMEASDGLRATVRPTTSSSKRCPIGVPRCQVTYLVGASGGAGAIQLP